MSAQFPELLASPERRVQFIIHSEAFSRPANTPSWGDPGVLLTRAVVVVHALFVGLAADG